MAKTPVAIVRCSSYDEPIVEAAVRKALGLLPEFDEILGHAGNVLLKTNITQIRPLETGVTTHPLVVKAVAVIARERGCGVTIGEGSGASGWPMWRRIHSIIFDRLKGRFPGKEYAELNRLYDKITGIRTVSDLMHLRFRGIRGPIVKKEELGIDRAIDVFGTAGIGRIARESGTGLVFFDVDDTVTRRPAAARFLKQVPIARSVVDADRVISVAKFKTHDDMVITGALKNLFGIVPTPVRGPFHSTAKFCDRLGDMLVDVFSTVRPPPLAVTDGILGVEGRGPIRGTPRRMGIIIASPDCVAHDAVMADLMGLEPFEVPMVRIAHEQGLGEGRLDHIEVRGVQCRAVRKTDWKLVLNG